MWQTGEWHERPDSLDAGLNCREEDGMDLSDWKVVELPFPEMEIARLELVTYTLRTYRSPN